jgi:hypothetical protein
MWRHFLLLGILIAAPAIGRCDSVQFTVNPANIGTLYKGGSIDLFSSGLSGAMLSGQSLSLDLVLSNDVLARLTVSDPSFGISPIVHTNAGAAPGFADASTTGFLLDSSGNRLGASQTAGRSDGSDGTFTIGLDPIQGGDISGVHFDTVFPDTGFVVTDAQLRFSINSPNNGLIFGTAQQLPESSNRWDYLGLSVLLAIVLYGARRYRAVEVV